MRPAQRIALLVENASNTGGNRVIFNLARDLRTQPDTEVLVCVLPKKMRGIRDRLRAARDLVRRWRKFGFRGMRTLRGEAGFDRFTTIISTSRRTLDFVTDVAHPGHIHLFQHIEAWDTLNSPQFETFCRKHYPSAPECVDLVRSIGIRVDLDYLEKLSRVRSFRTVSHFLEAIALKLAPAAGVEVNEPAPHIQRAQPVGARSYDLMMFIRGLPFKGDALIVDLVNQLAETPYRIALVCGRGTKALADQVRARDAVTKFFEPPDDVLAGIFSGSRAVVHASLCEGFGSIPQEALGFGCKSIASRTGWLEKVESAGNLRVVNVHQVERYIREITLALNEKA